MPEWFSLQFCSEKFLITRRIERDMIKMYIDLHVKNPLFCHILIKIKVYRQIFEKHRIIRFYESLFSR
jgi:hypothetical protein